MATPLQQAQCELLAFPWTPDVLAMCNLLAASAGDVADMQRGFAAQSKSGATPFNALLMPEMANLQEGELLGFGVSCLLSNLLTMSKASVAHQRCCRHPISFIARGCTCSIPLQNITRCGCTPLH